MRGKARLPNNRRRQAQAGIVPDTLLAERAGYTQVILGQRLQDALASLNPGWANRYWS